MPQVPYASPAEWWDACARARTACCRSVAQEVQNVKLRSHFSRTLVWTEFDALMLGRFDGARLFAACFESMLLCTEHRAAGWCRKIARQVTRAATAALHAFLLEHGPHFCTARIACPCTGLLCRRMQARVSNVLAAAAHRLMTASFVYTEDRLLWPRCLLPGMRVALCMGQHPRLGSQSPLLHINPDVLQLIMILGGIEPRGPQGCPAGPRTCPADGKTPGDGV